MAIKKVLILKGDCIGPEIVNEAVKKVFMDFLLRKNYDNRRDWLIKNVPEINLNIP